MGILDTLFGSSPKSQQKRQIKPSSAPNEDTNEIVGGIIEINSIGFFGTFKKSKSGEWAICWKDSGLSGTNSHGEYVLYNLLQKRIVVQGRLERPNSGSVADNGIFSIEDWHLADGLHGTFYVFSASGQELIKKHVNANFLNSAVSIDGRLAIFQTCNNLNHDDGNTLNAFDVSKGTQLFSCHPVTGWAEGYEFQTETSFFVVKIKDVGKFKYDDKGTFVDSQKFENARLKSKSFSQAIFAAEEIIKDENTSPKRVQAALEGIINARINGADNDNQWKAHALKAQGIANELLGNYQEALGNYEEALTLNPKIVVKKKADALRKRFA